MKATTFPLFRLPRELRDRVYKFALVRDFIDIEPACCGSDDDSPELEAQAPNVKHRSTFVSSSKLMTYRLDQRSECACGECYSRDGPFLNLFYANRQVYEESRKVFYSQNTFQMPLGSGLLGLAFLNDRTPEALALIRNFSFDIFLHPTDFKYGRYGIKKMAELCQMINEKTSVRKIQLHIHGVVPDVTDDTKWKCNCDCAVFEHPLVALGMAVGVPGTPPPMTGKTHAAEWAMLEVLASITNLSRLTVNVDMCAHMLDHMEHGPDMFKHEHVRKFIQYFRTRMLKNGDELGLTQIQSFCRGGSDPRYRFHSADDEFGKSYLDPENKSHEFKLHNHQDTENEHEDGEEVDEDDDDEWGDDDDDEDSETNSDDTDEGMPDLDDMSADEDDDGDEESDEDMPSLEEMNDDAAIMAMLINGMRPPNPMPFLGQTTGSSMEEVD